MDKTTVRPAEGSTVVRLENAFSLLERNAPETYRELERNFPSEIIVSRSIRAEKRAINVECLGSTSLDSAQRAAIIATCRATLLVCEKLLKYYVPRARQRLAFAVTAQFYGQTSALLCSLSIVADITKYWGSATIVAAAVAAFGTAIAQWAQWRLGGKDSEGNSLYSIVETLEDAVVQLLGLDHMLAILDPNVEQHADLIVADMAIVNKVFGDINKATGNPRIYNKSQPDFSVMLV